MRNQRGFALIEVLIVVMIIAIVTTLAIPNLIEALDRSKQSATVADIRAAGTALERYNFDHQGYPVVDGMKALAGELQPSYIKELPLRDRWDHPLVYEADGEGTTYTLRSPGKDGEFQAEAAVAAAGFAADIVCVDGVFVSEPEDEEE